MTLHLLCPSPLPYLVKLSSGFSLFDALPPTRTHPVSPFWILLKEIRRDGSLKGGEEEEEGEGQKEKKERVCVCV